MSPIRFLMPIAAAAATLLAGCTNTRHDGVEVAVIGDPADLAPKGTRFGLPGALVNAATHQGLVRMDETGDMVPGLAERWIVTDDGLSYIFRIRALDLPNGDRLDARAVQRALTRSLRQLKGTSLGLDLAKVRDVRAMTARVIEIRLESPMPGMLQLLAQPELGIHLPNIDTGPMTMERDGDEAVLAVMPPEARGLPAQPDWNEGVQQVRLSPISAAEAMRGFSQGRYEVVLGGTLADLPLVDVGPLSRGTVRLDSAIGLFGFDVVSRDGFLADPLNREALSMALDRKALIAPFNLGGWSSTTRVVAPGLPDDAGLVGERWSDMTLEQRRATASQRVAQWKSARPKEAQGPLALTVALPDGPGWGVLLEGMAAQLAAIDVTLTRAGAGQKADLALRDRVARYPSARWFLNQFNCKVSRATCADDVDFLVGLAAASQTAEERAGYLAEAETALEKADIFIPIGAPIRWSLVRSGVRGFAENPWGIHPLFPLARSPI